MFYSGRAAVAANRVQSAVPLAASVDALPSGQSPSLPGRDDVSGLMTSPDRYTFKGSTLVARRERESSRTPSARRRPAGKTCCSLANHYTYSIVLFAILVFLQRVPAVVAETASTMQAIARASPAHQPLPGTHATLGHVTVAPKTEVAAQRWTYILDNFDAEGTHLNRNTVRRVHWRR